MKAVITSLFQSALKEKKKQKQLKRLSWKTIKKIMLLKKQYQVQKTICNMIPKLTSLSAFPFFSLLESDTGVCVWM